MKILLLTHPLMSPQYERYQFLKLSVYCQGDFSDTEYRTLAHHPAQGTASKPHWYFKKAGLSAIQLLLFTGESDSALLQGTQELLRCEQCAPALKPSNHRNAVPKKCQQ